MPFTKTIAGQSRKVTLTGLSNTIVQLAEGDPIPEECRRVQLKHMGSLVGNTPIAWATEDPEHTLIAGDGDPLYPGFQIEVTRDNFDSFHIIRGGSQDIDVWLKELESEQDSL
jgi:hypothetical protein